MSGNSIAVMLHFHYLIFSHKAEALCGSRVHFMLKKRVEDGLGMESLSKYQSPLIAVPKS